MSRVKHYARSLASGYVLVGVNTFYTLAQVPLVLHFLSREQFGLWAVVSQLSLNFQILLDLGMTSSVARILIDHKDNPHSGGYGTVVKTACLVFLAQGFLCAAGGALVSLFLPGVMNIGAQYARLFCALMIWQSVLLGAMFCGRISALILQAHQRYDAQNYSQIGGFAVDLAVLWAGFELGWGIYSMVAGLAARLLFNHLFCLVAAWRLKLLPPREHRGRADWHTFRETFSFATDIFLLSVGQVLISLSQTPLITRMLGLEAAAVWSIATKAFIMAQIMIGRLSDYTVAAFSEMMVRGERERLRARFHDLVVLTAAIGGFVCLGVALCNGSFVHLWTHGRIVWGVENDLLMALFVVAYTGTRCHINLACQTKEICAMRYVYLVEGAVFISLGVLLVPQWKLAGIITAGIVSNLLCSGLYGLRRTTEYFGVRVNEVLIGWLQAPARMFFVVLALAVALWLATRNLPALPQLAIDATVLGVVGGFCCWQLGLPPELRAELAGKISRLQARFPGGGAPVAN